MQQVSKCIQEHVTEIGGSLIGNGLQFCMGKTHLDFHFYIEMQRCTHLNRRVKTSLIV